MFRVNVFIRKSSYLNKISLSTTIGTVMKVRNKTYSRYILNRYKLSIKHSTKWHVLHYFLLCCPGLFLESQNNSIQAEMAFLEAARQLRATLGISPPCLGTEDMAGGPQLEEEEQEGEKHEEEEAKAACQSPSVRPGEGQSYRGLTVDNLHCILLCLFFRVYI